MVAADNSQDVDFEIPYFAEYKFCLDNDNTQFSNNVKRVDIRLEEGETCIFRILFPFICR